MTIIRSDDLCNYSFSFYWYRFTFAQYSFYDKLAITGFYHADAGIPLAYNSPPYISNHVHTHHSFTEKAGHRSWNSPGPWPALLFIWLFSRPHGTRIIARKRSGFQYHTRRKVVVNQSEICRILVGAFDKWHLSALDFILLRIWIFHQNHLYFR